MDCVIEMADEEAIIRQGEYGNEKKILWGGRTVK